MSHKAADQNRSHIQVFAEINRIVAQPLVTKHGAARKHPHIRKLGKFVNQSFRNPITEVFLFRVAAAIDERKDCHRIQLHSPCAFVILHRA